MAILLGSAYGGIGYLFTLTTIVMSSVGGLSVNCYTVAKYLVYSCLGITQFTQQSHCLVLTQAILTNASEARNHI